MALSAPFLKGNDMSRIIRLLIVTGAVIALFSGLEAFAAQAELKEVVATVEQGYSTLSDLQADFIQKTMIPSVKREQKGNGTLAIRKIRGGAAMFRFDYVKPRQLIVSDGKLVWYYLPENAQVIETSVKGLFEGDNGIALSYLTGLGNISRDFKVQLLNGGRDDKGNYLLEMIPRKPGQNLDKLWITVSGAAVERYLKDGKPNAFPILASVTFDALGNKSTIEFANVRVNRGLGRATFTFKAPRGTEVIRH
jgi:outer membrane lipoprotein carrier protein